MFGLDGAPAIAGVKLRVCEDVVEPLDLSGWDPGGSEPGIRNSLFEGDNGDALQRSHCTATGVALRAASVCFGSHCDVRLAARTNRRR
jgi:hypothetical protein